MDWSNDRIRQLRRQFDIRHARTNLENLQTWAAQLHTSFVIEALNRIESEENNLADAFRRVSSPDELDDPEMARDFALALFDYYDRRSRWNEWEPIGAAGLAACQRLGDDESLKRAAPRMKNALGIVKRMQGKNTDALECYHSALSLTDDPGIQADAFTNIADILRLQGRVDEAVDYANRAIVLAQQINDGNRHAKGLEYLGLSLLTREDYEGCIEAYEQALELRQRLGNVARLAQIWTMLAYALTQRGEPEDLKRALQGYKISSQIDQETLNWQAVARYWGDIAATYNRMGDYQAAVYNSELALDRNQNIGFMRGVALNHARLTISYTGLLNWDKARQYADETCNLLNRDVLSVFDRKMVYRPLILALEQIIVQPQTSDDQRQTYQQAVDRLNSEFAAPAQCISCDVVSSKIIPPGGLVYADDLWTVNHVMAENGWRGWLVLQPKRHVESMSEFNEAELAGFAPMVARLDRALRTLLRAKKVYVCLFAEHVHCPHVHYHIIPRYEDTPVRGPAVFSAPKDQIPVADQNAVIDIVQQIRAFLQEH